MSDALLTVRRFVQRDEAMRKAGAEPYPGTVRRTLEYILGQGLEQDQGIRRWVVERASQPDYWIAKSALRLALKLADRDLTDDALEILNRVITSATEGNPGRLGTRGYSHLPDLERLILHPGLVSRYPETWGRRLIELQSAALYGHQEVEWPRTQERRRIWNETLGPIYDIPSEFAPDYDDHPDIWWYQHGHRDRDMRGVLIRSIDQGLAEAVQLPEPSALRFLAELLFEQRWVLGFCQVLAALFDRIRTLLPTVTWHVDIAAAYLADKRCERLLGAMNFRRLLRRQLRSLLPPHASELILDCIRTDALNDRVKANELADLEEWNLLTLPETEMVNQARSRGDLFEPYDPREAPRSVATWTGGSRVRERLPDRWPHPEDREALRVFLTAERPSPDSTRADLEAWMLPRVQTLTVIAERPEVSNDEWFGEVAGWCEQVVAAIKRWVELSTPEGGNDARLFGSAYIEALGAHAPWWKKEARLCLGRMQTDVPGNHHGQRTNHLCWSSNDPIYQAASFLDELLAVRGCQGLEEYREQFGSIIARKWPEWPPFTRATVLTCVRPFHWATIAELRILLTSVVEQETQADVFERAMLHVLQAGSPDVAPMMQRMWQRIGSMSDPGRTARLTGEVVGNAAIRHRGEAETGPVLKVLADWCDQLCTERNEPLEVRGELINGILWGAKQHLGSSEKLTERHAEAWLPLAQSVAGEFLDTQCGSEGRADVLKAMMFVLEMQWPDEVRARLYDELRSVFERVIREGTVGQFSDVHHHIRQELAQDQYAEKHDKRRRPIAPSDELLVTLCRASAQRVADWRSAGETTRDLGYGPCLWGGDTADLIRHVHEYARDRDFVRRELASIVDTLAGAGLTQLATELRLRLRKS